MHNITKPIFKDIIIICEIYICSSYVIDMNVLSFLYNKKKFTSINSFVRNNKNT